MPSPFPGMDPYLENPVLWPGLHLGLIADLQSALNRLIRPKYLARVEERFYVSDENDPGRSVLVPDLRVISGETSNWMHRPQGAASSITGTIEPLEVTTFIEEDIHEARIEVLDSENRGVVTVIEILSPTNKLQGSRGQESYLKKRSEVMHSSSHLLEIDLLRAGNRIFVREHLPPHEYLAHVSRATISYRRRGTVWPIPITKRLPVIPIPLREGDADVEVDLQLIFEASYDRGAYDADLDYIRDPVPALTAEQAAWAKSLIANRKVSYP